MLDISVIIPTYNRAQDLRKTLEGIVRADKGNLAVEIVVVDNGNTDQTKLVVESFYGRLQIQYIFEARSGKNCALNTALERCTLGQIVVFVDDDVDVPSDWLISIRAVCDRWPNHSAFWGRTNVVFPVEKVPKWASDSFISALAFATYNYSKTETVISNNETPWGPAFWVRREIFEGGRRFNEVIGPRPKNRIKGSEESFARALLKDNYEIVYSPTVIVEHRIQPEILKWSAICARAYQLGRGFPHMRGFPQAGLLKNHPTAWWLYRCGAITWNSFKLLRSAIISSNENRLTNCLWKIQKLGMQIEAMRIAKEIQKDARLQD